ncbi:hypothetical protein AB9M62_41250 [Bacillales bacterium AN1005]
MNSFFESGIPTIVSIMTVFFLFIKTFIKTFNKTIIDYTMEVRNISLWEKFLEHILTSFVLVVLLLIPIFIVELSTFTAYFIFYATVFIFLISGLIITIYLIRFMFKGFHSKVLNVFVFINFISVIFMPFQVIKTLNMDALYKLLSNYIVSFLVLSVLVTYIAFTLDIYPKLFKYFNKKESKKLKIKVIADPSNELETLHFHYMLDSERHVLSESRKLEKINDSFFIYYPKENVLLKYYY